MYIAPDGKQYFDQKRYHERLAINEAEANNTLKLKKILNHYQYLCTPNFLTELLSENINHHNSGNLKTVKFLLGKGAIPKDKNSQIPLKSISYNEPEVIQELLKYINIEEFSYAPNLVSKICLNPISNKNFKMVKFLYNNFSLENLNVTLDEVIQEMSTSQIDTMSFLMEKFNIRPEQVLKYIYEHKKQKQYFNTSIENIQFLEAMVERNTIDTEKPKIKKILKTL